MAVSNKADDGLTTATDAPAGAPRDTHSREHIKTRLDAFTEATRAFSEAVRNGVRPSGMLSGKPTEEDS